MTIDPNARRRAQSFQKKVKKYIAEQVAKIVDIMEVIEITDENRLIVRSLDPETDTSHELPHTKNVRAEVGDRVVVMVIGGHLTITGVLRRPGQTEDDSIPFAGDGGSPFAAHADHQHRDGTYTSSVRIAGTVTQDNAVVVGVASRAGDRGVAIGSFAKAEGQQSVVVGHWAGRNGMGVYAVALGSDADATDQRAIAIGFQSTASGARSVAIGSAASASGTRSIAIGDGAVSSNNDRAVIKADTLFVDSSSGSGLPTAIILRREGDGSGGVIKLDVQSRIWVGNEYYVRATDVITTRFKPNRKVGGATAALKSYPANAAGGVAITAGTPFFQSAITNADGYSWYVAWSHMGVGYIRSDQTVAL